MVQDGCNCYFSFWAILKNEKKNKKKKKKKKNPGDIIILHMCTKHYDKMKSGS